MSSDSLTPLPAHWEPFRFFLGSWRGTGQGRPGSSQLSRSYELILQSQFILLRHRSEYPPQEANPEGEVHEELGVFSYDSQRDTFVFREFHGESYVLQYLVQDDTPAGVVAFVTETTENFPLGWRARATYKIVDENRFQEIFDLAGPGQPWSTLITSEFTRVP